MKEEIIKANICGMTKRADWRGTRKKININWDGRRSHRKVGGRGGGVESVVTGKKNMREEHQAKCDEKRKKAKTKRGGP